MNFYKHHIGDYAQATAHLTFVEDSAYSRLLRKYYAEEKPIPADLKAAQRLVGARTRDEKDAVETVLGEFFVLEADGWHNKRADEELGRWQAQAEANRRVAEEREANKRARLANVKGTNRGGGENDSSNDSLRVGEHESLPSREPNQKPEARSLEKASTPESAQGEHSARSPAADHAIALNHLGVRCTAHDPRLLDAVAAGVTVQHLTDLAKAHPGKGAPYLIATARGQLSDGATTPAGTANGTRQPRESLVDRNARRANEILKRTGTE